MSDVNTLKERMAAPDWDMWLALAGTVLERLADAKTARRKDAKRPGLGASPPQPRADTAPASPELQRVPAPPPPPPPPPLPPPLPPVVSRAARRLNRAAGVAAASVLAECVAEHRGAEVRTGAIYLPLAGSALSLLTAMHAAAERRPRPRAARVAGFALAALAGSAGVASRVAAPDATSGRSSWRALFGASPRGAPQALAVSGLAGLLAERMRNATPGKAPRVLGLHVGRVLGLATAGALAGTAVEAARPLLRAPVRDRFAYLTPSVATLAALALGRAVMAPARVRRRLTRNCLRLAALAGFAGTAWAHRAAAARPPALTAPALALAGLTALDLLEARTARPRRIREPGEP